MSTAVEMLKQDWTGYYQAKREVLGEAGTAMSWLIYIPQ